MVFWAAAKSIVEQTCAASPYNHASRLRRTRGAVADCQGPIVDGSGALGIRFHDLWATDKNHKVDNFFAYSRRGAEHTLQTLADACRGPGARPL